MSGADQFKQFKKYIGAPIGSSTPGISLNEVRQFINQSYYFDNVPQIGQNGVSIGDLFTTASNANMNLYASNFDFVEPHDMLEFIGLNYLNNDGPTISLNGPSSVTIQGGFHHLIDSPEYSTSDAYSRLDPVKYSGILYIALQNQAAGANKFPNQFPAYWLQISQPFYYSFASFDIQLLQAGSWQTMNNTTLVLCDSAASAQVFATLFGYSINAGSTIIGPGAPNGSNPSFWSKSGNDLKLHFNQTWAIQSGGIFAGAHVQTISNYFTRSNTNFISNTFRWPGALANFDSRIVENPVYQSSCQWLYMVNDVGCGQRIQYYEPGATASDREEGNMTSNIHGRVHQWNYYTSQWDLIDWWGWSSNPSSVSLAIYNKQYTGYTPGRYINQITKYNQLLPNNSFSAHFRIIYDVVDYWDEIASTTLYIEVT